MVTSDAQALYEACGGDMNEVARRLNLPVDQIMPARRRQPPETLGRKEMRKFQVSSRHADTPVWPKEHEKSIGLARAKFEAGTHEMCQGRDGEWFILYLIPRRQPTKPRRFFKTHS